MGSLSKLLIHSQQLGRFGIFALEFGKAMIKDGRNIVIIHSSQRTSD